jgi:hypothetical protein
VGGMCRFFQPFLAAIFKPTRRKPGYSPDPGFRFVNKYYAIVRRAWNKGPAYRNVSADFSLRIKILF